MRPIRDIAAIRKDAVLYHSAFGFARVTDVRSEGVALEWQHDGENLPKRVSVDAVKRVYALCPDEGFFHRALHSQEELLQLLQVDPARGIELLLEDLQGPQRMADIREWLVSRGLLTKRSFDRWWLRLLQSIEHDVRFHVEQETVYLEKTDDLTGPIQRLRTGNLSPGRRLDLALANREDLEPEFLLNQITLSWRLGGTQVRDLALKASTSFTPKEVLESLLSPGPNNLEALIHFLRRGRHAPDTVPSVLHQDLIQRVLRGIEEGSPLDNEGRLAAALLRWGAKDFAATLTRTATIPDGRRLLRSTFAALPPRRAEIFALRMLEHALPGGDDGPAQWFGQELLSLNLIDADEMAEKLRATHPTLAQWYDVHFRDLLNDRPDYDEYTDDTAFTAEIDMGEVITAPVAFCDLPTRTGGSLLSMGLALARALAQEHKSQGIANPTESSTRILPDGSIQITRGDASFSPRPLMEDPSPSADVYAGAVLLLQAILGKQWPRNIEAGRVIPYLRTIIPMLPPSALAPLDRALSPNPARRPKDGLSWLALWQHAAIAEESRSYAARNPLARVRWGLDSHIGRQKVLVTQTNQDALFSATDGNKSLLLVCDGISTANAGSGDLASGIASQIIANLWEQALPRLSSASPSELRDFLDRALRIANQAVCEAALRFAGGNLDGRVPMGTTAVVAVTHGNWVSLAWLGDSRAYLVGPCGAALITSDDNQAGERLRAWHLGYSKVWDPGGYALVGYVGHFNELAVPEPIPANHASFNLNQGERLVLCSDGLTDYIAESPSEVSYLIAKVILKTPNLDDAARRLVSLANKGGGGDNISVVVGALAG